jgi:FKBP-type peptidyl-prolyl cis-trans isomerase FklB
MKLLKMKFCDCAEEEMISGDNYFVKGIKMSKVIYKNLLLFSCFLLLTFSQSFAADEKHNPENQKDRESYSIGYQVGLSIQKDGVEINFDMLIQGLRDAIDGKEPLLSEEEMKSLILDLKKKAAEEQMRKIQEARAENAEEAAKFLEENGIKEGVKTTESGLQYRILREGDGASPGPEDPVTAHYRGTFIDGTEFDSSYSRGKPQMFQTNAVIKGWTEALQMMKTGSKWEIFVPPQLAYGRGGMGERIPPNKLLVFEIELLAVEKKKETEENKAEERQQ